MMSNDELNHIDENSLSELWSVQQHADEAWGAEDLAAILRHQLAAPLKDDLARFDESWWQSPENNAGLAPNLQLFGDLLEHPTPPLELLQSAKRFARASDESNGGALPAKVATTLYLASISAALVRLDQKITATSSEDLAGHLRRALQQDWLPDSLRVLLENALQKTSY